MASNAGAKYASLIKTALAWGVRPSVVILGTDSRRSWSKWDILLANAYDILQSERCSQCGLPRYICHNESNNVQFRMIEDQCSAMVFKENYEETRSKSKTAKKPKGTVLIPEPYTVDKSEFVELRMPYYEAEAERRRIIEDS